ncbi:MAG: hypothetical protein CMP12_19335 [Zunongwangia sp.]|jgi:hypothetical protein|uniref:hypothetical protein n=1 Tax=Zunongwangia profunda TaxID=398743 RepID=UPI000C8F18B0|nr:hypothetical protein [Zunongwangia profunda]MAO38023.1 hypothetical protein [Zunongwangia sp.]MCC4230011.1 hypothetical protein [Zunongwangia profunda]|tara:strand:- start:102 stop:743 length:642 start_codon:yes stop_codon:yes gene_type:complete
MNKITFKLLLALTILVGATVEAQTNLFEHPDFETIAKDHKSIAIIPFSAKVSLRPKQMKEITAEQLKEMEMHEGQSIQTAMYSWFLKRRKRGKLLIEVQDPNTTNAILNKNEIDLSVTTPKELATLLNVDAVITGKFETDKPMSDGASLALGLLVGFWGTTNSATVNMSINNAEDGVLLWNYNKRVAGSLGSSNDQLINKLMRKASRRLAYTK